MRTIQASEAKVRLAEILRQVERGERFAITRHRKTIAHLLPVADRDAAERDRAVDQFLRVRANWPAAELALEEILEARHADHRF